MEEFNSDERFLVPDSEDEDLNSREPWDLVSGLEALTSSGHRRISSEDHDLISDSQAMSSSPINKSGVFPPCDSNESAGENVQKKTTLAYDTVSSDIDSGECHDQTVIERKTSDEKERMEKETSTPSEHIKNLQFSQDAVLVPETLDSVGDGGGHSPNLFHTGSFIVPDSPSQEMEVEGDNNENRQQEDEIGFMWTSSTNSQSSAKIESQGLHLHLSQSQQESSPNHGSLERDETNVETGVVTTPIKDPTMSLSCRKLTLKDAPPSPQLRDSLPKPIFHLPSKLQMSSTSDNEDLTETNKSGGESELVVERPGNLQKESSRSGKKQSKKQRLFMDTQEEASTSKGKVLLEDRETKTGSSDRILKHKESQPLVEASLVLIEEPESMAVDEDHTMSYDYIPTLDEDRRRSKPSRDSISESRNTEPSAITAKDKEESQSQADFEGFDQEAQEGVENVEGDLETVSATDSHQPEKLSFSHITKEDSPNAPSSQVTLTEYEKLTVQEADKDTGQGSSSIHHALSEVSVLTESHAHDPYQFQGSQSQNAADISNQLLTDRSKLFNKSGSKVKVVKVMRKVLKKKVPPKTDQKSSSAEEAGSTNKSIRSAALRRKTSAIKQGSKAKLKKVQEKNNNVTDNLTEQMEHDGNFTTLQSRTSDTSSRVGVPLSSSGAHAAASSEMPPPLAIADSTKKSSMSSGTEMLPQELSRLSKKATVVSFQDGPLPKVKSLTKEVAEPTNGEIERKTVREFKAIVVERETTVDILDDKGRILKQTITKEVIRTPVEPPWLAMNVQVTERILSPNVSPSRSVSTLTSGDLADVSSSSLSRSMSSGSKGSNPSLDFCSQGYPTPAQRILPLESVSTRLGPHGGDETIGVGKVSTTRTVSSISKLDSKRLSSGSNTGQDLFGSPDESLITHCGDGGHFDRPPSSSNSTPGNISNPIGLMSATAQQSRNENLHEMKEGDKDNEVTESRTGEDETMENVKAMDESPSVEKTSPRSEERHLRGRGNEKAPNTHNDGKDVTPQSRGRGKRKNDNKESQPGKKARQDRLRDGQDKVEGEGGEASESSLSTGFVVQETNQSHRASPHGKASSSKSNEDLQPPMAPGDDAETSVGQMAPLDIKSRLIVGEQVMGKWTDNFYYPGILKKMESANMRYQVKFDDGTQRWLGPEGLLLARELPIGQSVMVMRDDGYYECGMILAHSWTGGEGDGADNTLIYHVERDDRVTQKCQRKCLLLSEDQAACLLSDHSLCLPHDVVPTTATKAGDISLDNLIDGKRQHRAKSEKPGSSTSVVSENKSAKTPGGEETPNEGGSRSVRKRKVGPVATSTPTQKQISKSTHDAGTPVKLDKTNTFSSVVFSPSVSRRSPRKTRLGLFGQKLSAPPDLFKGLLFLLTHIEKTEEQRQEEKNIVGYSSLEDTSFDENPEENEEVHPFVKEQLESLILAGGGKLLDKYDAEEIEKAGPSSCYLVAAEHQRTVKYLQALAGHITIVSHQWILHSVDQGHLLGLKAFLLPAGISLEKKKMMECKKTGTQLIGQTILIVSNRNEFIATWASILTLSKCHVATRFPTKASKADPGIDFVVTDTTCPATIVRKCRNLDVPLVSSEWIAQCLINNCMVDHTSEKYRHDFVS